MTVKKDKSVNSKTYCVYMHTNKINNKKYIGQTCKNVRDRWRNGVGYINSPYFWNAIQKYGWDNFEHEIIANNLTKEEADKMEIELIALYDTTNDKNGYNLTSGGGGVSGFVFSEESKRKMSEFQKKRWTDDLKEEWSKRYSGENNPMYGVSRYGEENPMYGVHRYGEENPMYGKHLSDEAKLKIGEAHKKENWPKEGRQVISDKAKERLSDPTKNPMYGKNHTIEAREKMSISAKARCTDEWRLNVSERLKGKFAGDKNPNYGNGSRVVQLTKDNTVLDVYISSSQAEKITGVRSSSVRACCIGRYKTAGGYYWKYLHDKIQTDGSVILGAITLGFITENEAQQILNQLDK